MKVLVIGSSLFDVIVALENNPHITIEGSRASFALGDKVPVDIKTFSIGGNGPNVASALQKLTIPNLFYTYLGEDALSKYISQRLSEEGISVCYDTTTSATGPLSLIFNFTQDRTIFSHHPEFDHGFDEAKVGEIPSHIFLTSLGKTWESAYDKVLSYASTHNIPLAFSPGSQQMKNINETFIKTVHQAKMLFCNMEEAKIINKTLSGHDIEDKRDLLLNLKNNGFELLSITDGAEGAYAVDNENRVYKIKTLKPEGHEKTGAGDAYAAAFLAAYVQGKEISICMKWGVLNALGVMSHVGAHTGQLKLDEMEQKNSEIELTAEQI
jgi:sugar/nucleoside kinase (ribokinase family)